MVDLPTCFPQSLAKRVAISSWVAVGWSVGDDLFLLGDGKLCSSSFCWRLRHYKGFYTFKRLINLTAIAPFFYPILTPVLKDLIFSLN